MRLRMFIILCRQIFAKSSRLLWVDLVMDCCYHQILFLYMSPVGGPNPFWYTFSLCGCVVRLARHVQGGHRADSFRCFRREYTMQLTAAIQFVLLWEILVLVFWSVHHLCSCCILRFLSCHCQCIWCWSLIGCWLLIWFRFEKWVAARV